MKNTARKLLSLALLVLTLIGPASAQCPSIDYMERSQNIIYQRRGWDTVVTCTNRTIWLKATTFITTQIFNGTYSVESIPFDPPHAFNTGTRIFATCDDVYADSIHLPFPFAFFGVPYTRASVGANGVLTFNYPPNSQTYTCSDVSDPRFCPYSYGSVTSATSTSFPILNAIYGVYEDIDPRYCSSTGVSGAGIYQAVLDTFPCRKLCVSWNGIPGFGTSSASSHYDVSQMVLYEGTNIIDIYVQHRTGQASTSQNIGTVGIQNAAGTSAYTAPGRNCWGGDITTPEAWRFTPQGSTIYNIMWYEGTDTSAATGHMIATQRDSIQVTPEQTTTYTMRLKYMDATGNWFDLASHVTVGVDRGNMFSMTANGNAINSDNPNDHICQGHGTVLQLSNPDTDIPDHITWNCSNSRARYSLSPDRKTLTMNPITFLPTQELKNDTTKFEVTIDFRNGCTNSDSVKVITFPRYDYDTVAHICEGHEIDFHGTMYDETGVYTANLTSQYGCPFTKTMSLYVHETSESTTEVKDCHPYTWIDSNTYTETTIEPTVILRNRYGCDSTVHLHYYFDNSLKAGLTATPEQVTLENLSIQLQDVSLGSNGRVWYLPNFETDTSKMFFYNFPAEYDSINIKMVASSAFGCYDTAGITIPLLKEAIWFPNAFTPRLDVNNTFYFRGLGILDLHVSIFNRMGEKVGEFSGLDGSWDGTCNGQLCSPGAYVYYATYSTVLHPERVEQKKGTVMLIK